jgi:hypothetical protein
VLFEKLSRIKKRERGTGGEKEERVKDRRRRRRGGLSKVLERSPQDFHRVSRKQIFKSCSS